MTREERRMRVFEEVAARRMTPDEGARLLNEKCWPPGGVDPELACRICDGDCVPACIYDKARRARVAGTTGGRER